MPGSSFLFQLMLFFFSFLSVSLTHFPPFILTSTLLLFLPFNSFTLSLSLHLPPALIRPHVTLFCICIKSPSLSALGLDYHLQLSFCPSVDGFEVLLWNVWVGEKNLFCAKKKKKKMITYHFSVLVLSLSRWICSQQCHRVSLEMTFYSVSRSQWGHAAGTTLWLRLYPHYSFLLKSSPDLGAEGKEQSVDFCHLSQPPKSCPVHDRQSNYEKLACLPKPQEKNTCSQKPSFHLDTLNHRESLDDRWASVQKFPLCTRVNE